ncbi:MAG: rhodanese-like domain-containing protein [Flavobacteriales bacterium]|jgi:rhodanese-related sulfurtransferase|nr:rhodanese-like domain-containing protein [Flavobacteriales bacterium]
MKYLSLLLIVALSATTVACQTASSSEQQISKDLPPSQFAEMSASNPGIILDVRTPSEVRDGHIAGMTAIDITAPDFMDRIARLDRQKPVYVYCAVGGRSANAAQKLKDLGFKEVYNLDGGIRAWIQNKLPLEK